LPGERCLDPGATDGLTPPIKAVGSAFRDILSIGHLSQRAGLFEQ
jgi:hypothetical protein